MVVLVRSRALLLVVWLVATATGTGLTWAVVASVVSDVAVDATPEHTGLVREATVGVGRVQGVSGIISGAASQERAVGTSRASSATAALGPSERASTATTVAHAQPSTPSATTRSSTTIATPTSDGASPSTSSATPSPNEAPAPTGTPTPATTAATTGRTAYATNGGSVTVHCTAPSSIELVAASPNDGWVVEVDDAGPDQVGVHFTGRGEVELQLVCHGGQPSRRAG